MISRIELNYPRSELSKISLESRDEKVYFSRVIKIRIVQSLLDLRVRIETNILRKTYI